LKKEELDLIKLAKKDAYAMEKLLIDYKHLVGAASRRYFLIGADQEDLAQEGMIGLVKAVQSFEVDKNDNFSAYANMLIEREMISAIRRANCGGQQVLSDSILIDNDDELGGEDCPESDFIAEESTNELTKEIFSRLSNFEKLVVEYYLKGYTYVDIANIMKRSAKSIDNALSRIKKKLEDIKERL